MALRLVVADDHRLFRQALCGLIHGFAGMEVVGEAHNGEDAIRKARDLRPDIVLMDLEMPNINGVVATRLISERLPEIKVVVLSAYEDDARISAAMQAGAWGYVLKHVDSDELCTILHAIHRGEPVLSPYLANQILPETTRAASKVGEELRARLTVQELQVLQQVVDGLSNDAIAATLYMGKDTVKAHLKRIFGKLQVENRTKAAVLAVKAKVIG
jgi:DNA-binding NarL/FixJ family response regulator